MKNLKLLIITLVTALIVAGTVLVGVPAYKSWATTDACLYDSVATAVPEEHEFYPCGYFFHVKHQGIGSGSGCECAHQPQWVKLHVVHDVYGDISGYMSYYDSVACQTQDGSEWCGVVHFHRGEWYYYYECSDGEFLPSSGYYGPIYVTDEHCTELTHVEPCQ